MEEGTEAEKVELSRITHLDSQRKRKQKSGLRALKSCAIGQCVFDVGILIYVIVLTVFLHRISTPSITNNTGMNDADRRNIEQKISELEDKIETLTKNQQAPSNAMDKTVQSEVAGELRNVKAKSPVALAPSEVTTFAAQTYDNDYSSGYEDETTLPMNVD